MDEMGFSTFLGLALSRLGGATVVGDTRCLLNGKANDFYAWECSARCFVSGVFYHFVLLVIVCLVRQDI